MHNLSFSRSLWMIKLQDADPTCSPIIPPHVPADALSDNELREALISPSRTYDRCMKGEARYGNQRSIFLPPLYYVTLYEPSPFCSETLKLTPGGRFLLASSVEVMHVIDVCNSGRSIWSLSARSRSEKDPRGRAMEIVAHTVDMCSDGSLALLLLYKAQDVRDAL